MLRSKIRSVYHFGPSSICISSIVLKYTHEILHQFYIARSTDATDPSHTLVPITIYYYYSNLFYFVNWVLLTVLERIEYFSGENDETVITYSKLHDDEAKEISKTNVHGV